MNLNLKDMISEGKNVNFVRYRGEELIYVTENGFEFPIPIEYLNSTTIYSQ